MSDIDNLDKRMALLEQKLHIIETNHLKHIQDDITMLKKIMGAVALTVFAQLIAVIVTGMQ
jgi:predicted neutral ceramidase superfamily lipid hydrolase